MSTAADADLLAAVDEACSVHLPAFHELQSCRVEAAERPWRNVGQAEVSVLSVTANMRHYAPNQSYLASRRSFRLVRKHGSVGRTVKGSTRVAADKLRSFAVEACFLRTISPHLLISPRPHPVPSKRQPPPPQPAAPVAWRLRHSDAERSFDMIMTDLTDKGFARREEALNFDDACAALDWLARLHGIMTNPIVTSAQIHLVSADGLWEQGTYWNLGKRNAVKQLTAGVMEAHWRAARRSLEGFADLPSASIGVDDDFPKRLFAAAAPIDRALHPPSPDAAEPKRRRTARHELPAPRLLRRVVVHGDFKAENLFFEPHVSGPNPRCAACDFQWAGLGVGACDVVYLLTTSLCDGLLAEREAELLQHYRRAVVREMGVYAPTPAEFEHEYAIALLDFARFVLADGDLVDGDEWICARADALLGRLEAAAAASGETYDAVLAAAPGPFVG